MKISEIVVENPSSYQQGKAMMNKIINPTNWLDGTDVQANYNKGRAAMDKVINPKQWFNKSTTSSAPKQISSHIIKQSLVNASMGKPLYQDDITALQSVEASAPDVATQQAIKLAYTRKPLTKEQQQLLANLSKKY